MEGNGGRGRGTRDPSFTRDHSFLASQSQEHRNSVLPSGISKQLPIADIPDAALRRSLQAVVDTLSNAFTAEMQMISLQMETRFAALAMQHYQAYPQDPAAAATAAQPSFSSSSAPTAPNEQSLAQVPSQRMPIVARPPPTASTPSPLEAIAAAAGAQVVTPGSSAPAMAAGGLLVRTPEEAGRSPFTGHSPPLRSVLPAVAGSPGTDGDDDDDEGHMRETQQERQARHRHERFIEKFATDAVYGKDKEQPGDPSRKMMGADHGSRRTMGGAASPTGDADGPGRGRRVLRQLNFLEWRRRRHKFDVEVKEPLPWGVLRPDGDFRQMWDLIAIILVLFLAVWLPYRVAFTEGEEPLPVTLVDFLIDLFFIGDVVINATTAYFEDDHLVYDRQKILFNYAKTWMLIDVIASFPAEWLFGFPLAGLSPEAALAHEAASSRANGTEGGGGGGTQDEAEEATELFSLLKVFKVVWLLKLLRVGRLFRYVSQFEAYVLNVLPHNALRLAKIVSIVLLFSHWNGCIQYLAAALDGFPADCWVVRAQLLEEGGEPLPYGDNVAVRYSWSFFNAISQMLAIGYGITEPYRLIEIWLCLISMLFGATLYAIFVASLTSFITELDASARDYHGKMDMVNQYMRHAQLPRPLRAKLRAFYALLYPGKRSFDEGRILGELSRSLLEEVTEHKCKPVLQALHIASDEKTDPGLSGALSRALHKAVYITGDYIIREGEPAEAMYFIEHGEVEVLAQGAAEAVATLTSGAFFGEMALLAADGRTLASVRVTVSCVTMMLDRSAYMSICSLYPSFQRYVESVARLRLKQHRGDRRGSDLQSMLKACRGNLARPPVAPRGQTAGFDSFDKSKTNRRKRFADGISTVANRVSSRLCTTATANVPRSLRHTGTGGDEAASRSRAGSRFSAASSGVCDDMDEASEWDGTDHAHAPAAEAPSRQGGRSPPLAHLEV